jgi:hypothetical protein
MRARGRSGSGAAGRSARGAGDGTKVQVGAPSSADVVVASLHASSRGREQAGPSASTTANGVAASARSNRGFIPSGRCTPRALAPAVGLGGLYEIYFARLLSREAQGGLRTSTHGMA